MLLSIRLYLIKIRLRVDLFLSASCSAHWSNEEERLKLSPLAE